MTFIDTNLTYSKQVCDYAVGGLMGMGAVYFAITKILFYLLCFYIVYRVTQIFLVKYSIKLNNLKASLQSAKVEKYKGVKNENRII